MKKYRQLFQDAERLTPSPGLWRLIEAQVELPSAGSKGGRGAAFWQSPILRVAASVVLAVGCLGLGLFMQHKPKQVAVTSVSAVAADAADSEQLELVDPELLGWHADLGEIDLEADEAEEVL
ncbi:MAG: hypothetical protein JWO30_3127 [Fibrobacteres bacterium]|nr:hypothetical protein [Fibrobacterota bacterium]